MSSRGLRSTGLIKLLHAAPLTGVHQAPKSGCCSDHVKAPPGYQHRQQQLTFMMTADAFAAWPELATLYRPECVQAPGPCCSTVAAALRVGVSALLVQNL
jgi:hypothetical protein